MVRENNTY